MGDAATTAALNQQAEAQKTFERKLEERDKRRKAAEEAREKQRRSEAAERQANQDVTREQMNNDISMLKDDQAELQRRGEIQRQQGEEKLREVQAVGKEVIESRKAEHDRGMNQIRADGDAEREEKKDNQNKLVAAHNQRVEDERTTHTRDVTRLENQMAQSRIDQRSEIDEKKEDLSKLKQLNRIDEKEMEKEVKQQVAGQNHDILQLQRIEYTRQIEILNSSAKMYAIRDSAAMYKNEIIPAKNTSERAHKNVKIVHEYGLGLSAKVGDNETYKNLPKDDKESNNFANACDEAVKAIELAEHQITNGAVNSLLMLPHGLEERERETYLNTLRNISQSISDLRSLVVRLRINAEYRSSLAKFEGLLADLEKAMKVAQSEIRTIPSEAHLQEVEKERARLTAEMNRLNEQLHSADAITSSSMPMASIQH